MTASDGDLQVRPRFAVVYNPVKGDVKALRAAVIDHAAWAGWGDLLWFETTRDDAGESMTREALEQGATLVIAAGGDGTVRAVASGLRGTGVPLAVIPLGTGNLLARNLSLPLTDLAASARIAFSGSNRTIDIGIAQLTRRSGESSDHAFLVMAGLGIDAAMIENTSPELKRKVGWLAYIDGGMRSLATSKRVHITYQLHDRHEHSAHVSTILAGNCGVLPGNIELMPDARLDDGELDFAIMQPRSIFGWLMIWRAVSWENRVLRRSSWGRKVIRFTNSDNRRMLTYRRGVGVRVTVENEQPIELDGDGFGKVVGVHFWADAGALTVRVS